MLKAWSGSWVALVTPFFENKIDYTSLGRLIQWHQANGTKGLVVLGTTGEAATITLEERQALIQFVVKEVAGSMPVMVGTGTNDTQTTLQLSQQAEAMGADALLVVTPYYNKPSQLGLVSHFEKVATTVDCPLLLYNVPGRTGCDLSDESIVNLANHPNIIGLKDATADLSRLKNLRQLNDFYLYSGDDATACDFQLQGGDGVISVTANICPALMHWMCQACLAGDERSARGYNQSMVQLHDDLFVEGNPVPVKWLLACLRRIRCGDLRLPLVALGEQYQDRVMRAWQCAEAAEMNLEND